MMAIGVVCILADGTNFKGLYYSTMKMKMTRKSEWYRRQLVVVVVACCIGVGWDTLSSSAAALANNDDSSSTLSTSPPPPLLQCDLYMAESTIPHAGLGIFTGVDRKEGDTVGNGDLCLPLIDIEANNGYIEGTTDYDQWESQFHDPFVDYVWDGIVMGMGFETERAKLLALWPGLDCAVNCNIPLVNVEKAFPAYTSVGVFRSKHPGAGAVSPYRAGSTKVIRDIPAGGELFKDYGDIWFTTRPLMFHGHPLSYSYTRAEKLLQGLFMDRFVTNMPPSLHEQLYNFVAVDLQRLWQSRTLNALPTTYRDAQFVLQEAGGELAVLHQPAAIRSMDWLQKNGKCVDHIVPGPSTIDGAGEGAFAKRDLPRGTLITGSPLHHIPHRRYLDMYAFVGGPPNPKDHPDKRERLGGPIGYQIVLNHCIGHPESTLLLFPYGLGVNYMNHNRTRANVEIRWAANGTLGQNASWLNLSPEEMEYQYSTNLAIDYVATKDIKKGEEMFLDYGDAWEQAWNKHVQSWRPSDEDDTYVLELSQDRFTFGQPPSDFQSNAIRWGRQRDALFFADKPWATDIHLISAFRHEIQLPERMMPDPWRNRVPPKDRRQGGSQPLGQEKLVDEL